MKTTAEPERTKGGRVALSKLLDALKCGDKLLCINTFLEWLTEDENKPNWYLMILAENALVALAEAKQVGFIRRITNMALELERDPNASV